MNDEAKRRLEVAIKATVFAAVIMALVTADVEMELHATQEIRAAIVNRQHDALAMGEVR